MASTVFPQFKGEEELKRLLVMGRTEVNVKSYSLLTSMPFSAMSFIYDRSRRISRKLTLRRDRKYLIDKLKDET